MSAQVRVDSYQGGQSAPLADAVRAVYAEVYAEPPYNEGQEDVERFARRFATHQQQPRFRLVVARRDREPIGFAYGYALRPTTTWWSDLVTEIPAEVTGETGSRTFAVLELAVHRQWRRRRIGRDLHDALLAGRPEERAVLMVNPSAQPAETAYAHWGWRIIGQARPWAGAPPYDVMIRPLSRSGQSWGM